MKTYSAKPSDITRSWYIVDASDAPIGRIATQVASLLMGKGKPMFTAHIDCGDYVVIVNAKELVVTGAKQRDKMYYRHSGYPSGLTETALKDMHSENPTKVLQTAIRGMLPVNKLRDARLARLKIYAGLEHNHDAQKPIRLNMKEGK